MALHRYWPLDETSGITALDTISETNADVIGDAAGASAVSAKFGYGRDFSLGDDGTSYLKLWPGTVSTTEYAAWSLVCWFRRDSTTGGDWVHLFNLGNSSAGSNGQATVDTYFYGGELFVDLRNASNNLVDRASHIATYYGNGWHLMVVTCDASVVRLYVDGALADSTAAAVQLMPDTGDSYFGFNTFDGAGDIFGDDLAIFTNELSAADVTALWNEGTGTSVSASLSPSAQILVPGPLSAPRAFVLNDLWGALPDSAQTRYHAELRTEGATIRLPISSWQATLQSGRQSYLQAVIPAAESYIDDILVAGLGSDLAIVQEVRFGSDQIFSDMALVTLQQMPYQRGPQRSTVTLSGYGTIAFESVDANAPPPGSVRAMSNVQLLSVQGGTRVRAEIDFLLRPGMIADADGTQFPVSYINYYVTSSLSYMDVGERAL